MSLELNTPSLICMQSVDHSSNQSITSVGSVFYENFLQNLMEELECWCLLDTPFAILSGFIMEALYDRFSREHFHDCSDHDHRCSLHVINDYNCPSQNSSVGPVKCEMVWCLSTQQVQYPSSENRYAPTPVNEMHTMCSSSYEGTLCFLGRYRQHWCRLCLRCFEML